MVVANRSSKSLKGQDGALYTGQPIIGSESFLRKFPQIVETKQRLAFDAMVMASDIIDLSLEKLRELAIEIGPDTSKISAIGVTHGISACWSIVDQMHALSELIKSEIGANSVGPKTSELLESLSVATVLRNKMDHLKSNLGNLAAKTGPKSPLFGSLSYVFVIDKASMSLCSMVLFSGALIDEQIAPIVNPVDQTTLLPVGLFELTAFGLTLRFEPVMLLLSQHFFRQEEAIEQQVRKAASAHASAHALNVEKLMAPASGAFGIAMFIGLDPPDLPAGLS